MKRWLVVTVAVVGLLFYAAHTSAQIKYSQRGFFMLDYKDCINCSRIRGASGTTDDGDFTESESVGFGTFRGRFWNTFSLGKDVFATWMFETDIMMGRLTDKDAGSSDSSAFNPRDLRGDRTNIETGELFLDFKIPHTDYRLRGGQIPMTVVLPVIQERTTGIKLYRSAGKIRPSILWIPAEEVQSAQGEDDNVFGAWVDFRLKKGFLLRPFWFGEFRNKQSGGDEDRNQSYFGFNARYSTKGWYANLNLAFQVGELEFRGVSPDPDKDISAVSTDGAFGLRRGAHTYSLVFLYRSGDDPRELEGQDIHAYTPIVAFFASGNRVTQMISSSFQHPSLDLEMAEFGGPNNDSDAGWFLAMLRWDWKVSKKTLFSAAYTHIRSNRSIDNDDVRGGDSTHVGEAFDLWLVYKVNRNLSFNAGTAFLFAGDALDSPGLVVGTSEDANNVWNGFVSAIFRF